MSTVAAVRSETRARRTSWRTPLSREAELAADIGVGAAVDGDGDERGALAVRKRGDAVERPAHVLAALDLDLGAEASWKGVAERGVVAPGALHGIHGSVMDDPVEPWPQIADLGVVAQCGPRADQSRLHDFLGAGLRQESTRIAQQWAAVALDDGLERPIVPGRGQVSQTLV